MPCSCKGRKFSTQAHDLAVRSTHAIDKKTRMLSDARRRTRFRNRQNTRTSQRLQDLNLEQSNSFAPKNTEKIEIQGDNTGR